MEDAPKTNRNIGRSYKIPVLTSRAIPAAIDIASWLEEPLDLEIGCGVGWHPIAYAIKNPDRHLIAIEHTRAKFEKFASRYERNSRPTNLLPVHANAMSWVAMNLPNDSLERVFLLYPNPWPKNPAQRWLRMPFFGELLKKLKRAGEITLVTNEKWYSSEAKDAAAQQWGLAIKEQRAISLKENPEFVPRTHFEQKYFNAGQTLHESVFSKLGR